MIRSAIRRTSPGDTRYPQPGASTSSGIDVRKAAGRRLEDDDPLRFEIGRHDEERPGPVEIGQVAVRLDEPDKSAAVSDAEVLGQALDVFPATSVADDNQLCVDRRHRQMGCPDDVVNVLLAIDPTDVQDDWPFWVDAVARG
jgi:hypothetical protein